MTDHRPSVPPRTSVPPRMSAPPPGMPPGMWLRIWGPVIIVVLVGVGLAVTLYSPEKFTAPTAPQDDMTPITLGEGCHVVVHAPSGSTSVHRRPSPGEMIVGEVRDRDVLDVVSVHEDWVRVRGTHDGYVMRRWTEERCEQVRTVGY